MSPEIAAGGSRRLGCAAILPGNRNCRSGQPPASAGGYLVAESGLAWENLVTMLCVVTRAWPLCGPAST